MTRPFPYLAPAARKYGVDAVQIHDPTGEIFDQDKFVDSLRPPDVKKLALVYLEVERRNDTAPVSAWINQDWSSDEHEQERREAFRLFLLFSALARRGIDPFARGTVALLRPPAPPLNWSRLPPEMSWLSAPAEKYGVIQFDSEVDRFLERITPEEFDELREVWRRCNTRTVQGLRKIYSMEDPEGLLLYFLFSLTNNYFDFGPRRGKGRTKGVPDAKNVIEFR